MAARKSTKPADEVLEEATEVEKEIVEETNGVDNTFTAEVMGEERTFVNHIAGKQPAELMMLSNDRIAMKVMPSLMEKILGEEMFDQILAEGAEIDDLTAILNAWGDTVKGKGSSSGK